MTGRPRSRCKPEEAARLLGVCPRTFRLFADAPGSTLSVLESLPEADFALLEQLPGVLVQRLEVLVVHPASDFFVEFSARIGDQADQRFAAALATTYPDGYWPVYSQRQTDYSGCTAFGEGKLLETYLAWSAMERDFPGRYMSAVAQERKTVAEDITTSTCACGDMASVVGELERIAAALTPADPIHAAVIERLATLDETLSTATSRSPGVRGCPFSVLQSYPRISAPSSR